MQEERKNGGNGGAESGEPRFTTPGMGGHLDETAAPGEPIPAPMEGQGGELREPVPEPAQPRPRRKSAAKRKGGAKKAGGKRKKAGGRTARAKGGAKRKGKARGAGRSRGRAKAKKGKKGRGSKRR